VTYRPYMPEGDKAAVHRILREVGWLDRGHEEAWDMVLGCGQAFVAEINGNAECIVSTVPGTMLYLDQELPLAEVNAVAASRIARQRGLTKGLVAHVLAAAAAQGAILSRVCVFDQGYYDQVGFGSGPYEHTFTFDPATLKCGSAAPPERARSAPDVRAQARVPRRLDVSDAALIHASRLARRRGHGSANYSAVEVTASELRQSDTAFGLGYCDGPSGELTHHFWVAPERVAHGPYAIQWMAYQTTAQFLELMALIKSLADQVQSVRLREPPGIQLQDLLRRPFRQHRATEQSRFASNHSAYAFWQARVCDLPACLARTHLDCREMRSNLRLTDPIEGLLHDAAPWRGVAGEYVVTLGPASRADRGSDPALPTLTASVNAFTRLWLGVRPATGLAVTDDLAGPASLLEQLDRALRLPEPKPDWDF